MKKATILILAISNFATADIETYICKGKEATYSCFRYTGGGLDVYNYPQSNNKSRSAVYEFSDAGTRNPYAPADDESRVTGEEDNSYLSPAFIPYNPAYLFPMFDLNK